MFKHILPQEAQISRRTNPQMDSHLQGSAFSPLSNALYLNAKKLSTALRRFSKKMN